MKSFFYFTQLFSKAISASCIVIISIILSLYFPKTISAQISDPIITNDNETLNISYTYTGEPSILHVYIDSDKDVRTGYVHSQIQNFGADNLIENDGLFVPKSDGGIWDFRYIGSINFNSNIGDDVTKRAEWVIDLSKLNLACPSSDKKEINLFFETNEANGVPLLLSRVYPYTLQCNKTSSVQISTPIPFIPLPYQIAVPGYFYPDGDDCTNKCYWTQIENAAPVVGIVIANPNSGAGISANPNYTQSIKSLQSKGILVLGYVYTSYGDRDIAQVKTEIDKYYEWYGINGIFLDEVKNTCDALSYYRNIYNYIKSKADSGQVVINPGINTEECFTAVSDIIVTFEDSYDAYVNWQPSGWEAKYPAKQFWNIIHSTSEENLSNAIKLAVERNSGWIYITSDTLGTDDNPYDTLPNDSYWDEEIKQIQNTQ